MRPFILLLYLVSALIFESGAHVTPCVPERTGNTSERSGYGVICHGFQVNEKRMPLGRGPGRKEDESPDSPSAPRPGQNDPNQQGPEEQPGGTGQGGMGRKGGTSGGMGSCNKRRWLGNWIPRWIPWRRCDKTLKPTPLDLSSIKARMDEAMRFNKKENDGPWIFWSGFDRNDEFDRWVTTATYNKGKMISDTWKNQDQKNKDLEIVDLSERWKFWAYNSKALGQYVKGDVVVILPKDKPLNKPYDDPEKGSNFWTYEFPELVRRPGEVNEIYTLRAEINPTTGQPRMGNVDYDRRHKIWAARWNHDPNDYTPYGPGDPEAKPRRDTGPDWVQPHTSQ